MKGGRMNNRIRKLVIVMLGLLAFASQGVQAYAATAPSPAAPPDAVVAGGVAALPATAVAWRVVQDTAESFGTAEFQQRALGFAVATKDPLLETDQATGAQRRLARGDASFTAVGSNSRRESLGTNSTAYVRIALVPAAKASDAGGDTLVFAGDSFTVPSGDREFDLVKGSLSKSRPTVSFTTDAGQPLVVFVLDGRIGVKTGERRATLAAGHAGAYAGTVALSVSGAEATFFVGLIGATIPAAPAGTSVATIAPAAPSSTAGPVATAASGAGSIAVVIHNCPAGTRNPSETACPVVAFSGFDLLLQSLDDKSAPVLGLSAATPVQDGGYFWPNLPYGAYNVVESTLPPGYDQYDSPGNERIRGSAMAGFHVAIDAAHANVVIQLYNLKAQPPGTGNVQILTVDAAGGALTGACYTISGPATFGPVCDGDAQDTSTGDGDVGFDAVPSGHYVVTQTQAPSGYAPATAEIDVIPAIQPQVVTVQNTASGTPTA